MNEIVKGSIADLAQRNNQSLAETFLSCDCVVLIDVSGSMSAYDNYDKSRYERACESLRNLQNSLEGKIAVVRFSHDVAFEPAGVPAFTGGGTDLKKGLQFIKAADVPGIRFIVISDGTPDNPQQALSMAKTFQNKIDVIFVGNELDSGAIAFMNDLARVSGGKQVTADCAKISETAKFLLNS